jgi:hypothetical protein
MRRSSVNFIVDLVALVDLILLAFTGVIMQFVLPPGTGGLGRLESGGAGREPVREMWGMSRHEWGDVHWVAAVLFVGLMVVHVVLHWGWIKGYVKGLVHRRPEQSS